MSERLTIAAEPRTITGKKVKQLRQAGIVPAVIYGQHEPVHIQMERGPLRRVLKRSSTSHLVDIELNGKTRTVLAREIQQHLTRGDVLHVDFYEVDMKVNIETEATLVLTGEVGTALEGSGAVVLVTHSVQIECLPGDLVAEIEVDVTTIKSPDDVIYASDLTVPKGVTILTDPETMIAHFEYMQAAEVEEQADVASVEAVEVVDRGKRDEAEG